MGRKIFAAVAENGPGIGRQVAEGLPATGARLEAATDERRSLRQAERSAATRAALLLAGEGVFARDGFEAARVEDIAADAGRSRGAFYANFESKTELFLALREQLVRKRAKEIRASIEDLPDAASRDAAIKRYLIGQVLNERQLLLEIEFKLFAARRPQMLPELSAKHLEASCRINFEELGPHFPEWRTEYDILRRNTLAIEAILEGLALNHLFHAGVMSAADIAGLVPGLVDRIVQAGESGAVQGQICDPCSL